MAPPQGAQPIIVCPVSGHAWRASGTRSNTERDCAVHPRRAAALAHRALVRRHLCRTRRGWATAHAPRGTLIRLPLAFLSGFVHLFVAEHVRRRWFLGVLVYLPAQFVGQTAYSASRRACVLTWRTSPVPKYDSVCWSAIKWFSNMLVRSRLVAALSSAPW